MPLPKVPTSGLDDINHRRRTRETLNQVLDHTFDDSRVVTAAEVAAGVTPVNKAYAPYNRSRYAGWEDWRAACDEAIAEGTVDGDWTLTEDIQLPIKSIFTGGLLSGAFTVLYQRRTSGWIKGLRCTNLTLRGIIYCEVSNIVCSGDVTIDGYNSTYGCFWNKFSEWNVNGTTTIDITNWAVNLNTWRGGRLDTLHITGDFSIYGATQAHANSFFGVDFTDGGVLQDDSAFEVNFMYGCYYELVQVTGNFHIFGYQADANGMPVIARFAHIMGSVGVNSRTSRDFFSLSTHNAVRGGHWDWLDVDGKPPGIGQSGGAGVAVVVDTTEPCGLGKRYESTFSAAFSQFFFTIQPNGTDRFGLLVFYKSTSSFVAIESNDGSGAISHNVTPVAVDSTNNWSMFRISGPASKTAATSVALFAYGAAGGAAKTMSIGGVFAGGERGVIPPHKNQDYESGRYTPTLTNTTNVAASTAYPMHFLRVGNTVQVSGRIDIDPTAAAPTLTEIGFTLPITPHTALSAAADLAGTGVSTSAGTVTQAGSVFADFANQRAKMLFVAGDAASLAWFLTFSYRMS